MANSEGHIRPPEGDNLSDTIDRYFPAPSYRDGQREAISEIVAAYKNGYDYVVLNAPTGAGKSIINTTVARLFDSAYYTTPLNSLIDQITSDGLISEYYVPLKGRSHYSCTNPDCPVDDEHTAGSCPSNQDTDEHGYHPDQHGACCSYSAFKDGYEPACPYPKQVSGALQSPAVLTNFHYFVVCPHFEKRDLAIVDEAHNLEGVGFDFCDIRLTDLFMDTGDPGPDTAAASPVRADYYRSSKRSVI